MYYFYLAKIVRHLEVNIAWYHEIPSKYYSINSIETKYRTFMSRKMLLRNVTLNEECQRVNKDFRTSKSVIFHFSKTDMA